MAYFKPDREDFNYLRHMILIGGNTDQAWKKEDFSCYVTHLNPDGNPDDWMFDTFTFWHF